MKRTPSAGLLLATALAALWLVPAPAVAASGACTSSSDVTVLVQFPDHTEVGCATGDPATGNAALTQAGFAPVYARGNGAGAICRIADFPVNNNCGSMPPGNAYWAYFQGKPGGGWTYSTEGAGTHRPDPGTVEGWRFGGGAAPTSPPPPVPKPVPSTGPSLNPNPKPTAKPAGSSTPRPATGSTGGSGGSSGGSGTAASTGTPTSSTTAASAPGDDASTGATPTPAATGAAAPTNGAGTGATAGSTDASGQALTRSADQSDARGDNQGSRSVSWIWGLLLLAALGAAGGVTALVRRRA
ncbi:MAG: hypothetical protein JWQ74_584 [Marmoricola sp.]|nr:hypothetical protein [Marmoricola sp.]